MYGAIVGDIVGSPYEFSRNKRKDFSPLFHPRAGLTDDTIMTVAVADSLMNEIPPAEAMRAWGRRVYPTESLGGYGAGFMRWLSAPEVQPPYNSYGNGAAMRISPVAWLFEDTETALEVGRLVTVVSHSHPEAVRGAGHRWDSRWPSPVHPYRNRGRHTRSVRVRPFMMSIRRGPT